MAMASKVRSFIYFFLRCLRKGTASVKAAFTRIVHYIVTKAYYVRQNNRTINEKPPGVLSVDRKDEDEGEETCGENEELINLHSAHWGLDTPITIDGPVFHRQRLPTVCEDEPCCHTPLEFAPAYEQTVNSGVSQTEQDSLLWDILNSSPEGLNSRSPVHWSSESDKGDPPVSQGDVCEVVERALMLVGNLPAPNKHAKVKLA